MAPRPKTKIDPKEVRRRLRDDFSFYAKNCVKIRTKAGEIQPLTLNSVQQKLDKVVESQLKATGKVRVIILKARQQGLSTYVSNWLYWYLSQHKAKKGLVVAHVADSTRALFDMYKRTHAEMPALMAPSTKYSSRKELVFDNLDTGLMVATAGGDSIARGETITHAHLSEVAFWPKATAADNLNALSQAVPNTDQTAVFIESTANGMSGPFYDLWKGAVEGTNGYVPFFSPWFDSEEYREPTDEGFERTYEEIDLAKEYNLDDEQLMFRRRKIAQNGREAFQQEYPSNPDEAFIASGRPVFNPDQIHGRLKEVDTPIKRMAMEAGVFREHPRGELLVYRDYHAGDLYYIGADVAMGLRNGDFSVAQVLDGQKQQVAIWRGHVHPDYFADILFALGTHYNEARIAVENNNHGLLTAVRLGRDLAYPNMFTDVSEGNLDDRFTDTYGFRTSSKTKPLIIDRLRAALREQEIELNDRVTLQEMLSYIVTESGSMEAEQGCFDDCVMALALANHIHEGKYTPIRVTDDYYVHAI
jgi:hypothetical protein